MTLFYIGETAIKLNASFLFCLAVWLASGNLKPFVFLSLTVFLHELAHAFTARLLGKHVTSVEMFIFGGAAEIEGIEDDFAGEIIIAAAGPMFSLLLGFLFGQASAFVPISPKLEEYSLAVATFNLIPAYPLDGGRILKCLLSEWKNGEKTAKVISIVISAIVCAFSVYQIISGQYGSFITMGIFLLVASVKSLKTLKNPFLRQVEKNREVKTLLADENEEVFRVFKKINGTRYHVILVTKDGRMKFAVDEKTLFDAVEQAPLEKIGKINKR